MPSELQMRILQELSKSDKWVEEADLDILKAHYQEPYAIVDALSSLYKEELIDILPRLSAGGIEIHPGQPMKTIEPDSYKITGKGRRAIMNLPSDLDSASCLVFDDNKNCYWMSFGISYRRPPTPIALAENEEMGNRELFKTCVLHVLGTLHPIPNFNDVVGFSITGSGLNHFPLNELEAEFSAYPGLAESFISRIADDILNSEAIRTRGAAFGIKVD